MAVGTGTALEPGVTVEGAVRVCIELPDAHAGPRDVEPGSGGLIERFLAWQAAEQVTPYAGGELGSARLLQTFPDTHTQAIKEFFAVPPPAVLEGPAVDFLATLAARIDAGEDSRSVQASVFGAPLPVSTDALAGALAGWLQTHHEPAVAAQRVSWPDEPTSGGAQLWLAARILCDRDLELPTAARWLSWLQPAVRYLLLLASHGFADRRVLRIFHVMREPG